MTAYNCEKYIKEAVDSMLNQTFSDFELIILDNQSSDATVNMVRLFKDERIVLVQNRENLGQTKALNLGLKMAKGEYIARMDADDYSYPERLELQYDFLSKNKNIAVVGAQYLEMNEEGKTLRPFYLPTDPLEIKCYLIGAPELSYHCVPHPIVLMRKAPLLDVGGYDERFIAQDFNLWMRLARKYEFANLSEVLFKYRIRQGNQTQNLRSTFQKDCAKTIYENISHYWPSLKEPQKEILWRMLNFLPQASGPEASQVFETFDQYFSKVVPVNSKSLKLRERIKAYYWPQMMTTSPVFALLNFFPLILKNVFILWDRKFYAKIFQTFFMKKNPTLTYNGVTR